MMENFARDTFVRQKGMFARVWKGTLAPRAVEMYRERLGVGT